MSVPFMAALDPLQDETAIVPVQSFELRETVSDGWVATATVVEDFEEPVSSAGLLGNLLANQVRPGYPVALHLLIAGEGEAAGEVVRLWPSVVTSITPFRDEEQDLAACRVRLRDIVGFHSGRAVWCAYRDMPLAEMFGGVLSSAGFGDGVPSRTPRMWPKVDVTIEQVLRDELNNVSYTISAGDTLRTWIDSVFGQLGVRYEMLGNDDGTVTITLRDGAPSGQPVPIEMVDRIGVTEPDKALDVTKMTLRDVQFLHSGNDKRALLLDSAAHGEFRRIGAHGSIGTVIADPNTSIEEAALRSEFSSASASLNSVRLIGTCSQSAMYPCNRVRFSGGTVAATDSWQVIEVEHGFRDGDYLNVSLMLRDYDPWRPPVAPTTPPILVTGVIDAQETQAKREVERDELGRVPVMFPFLPSAGESQAGLEEGVTSEMAGVDQEIGGTTEEMTDFDESPIGEGDPRLPRIHLGLLEPMAGGRHGMVSAARQGNVCRIAIYNPLFAEIVGFGYRGNLQIGKDFEDVSLGLLTKHSSPEDPWSGMLFRPTKGVPEKTEKEEDDEALDELLEETDPVLEAMIDQERDLVNTYLEADKPHQMVKKSTQTSGNDGISGGMVEEDPGTSGDDDGGGTTESGGGTTQSESTTSRQPMSTMSPSSSRSPTGSSRGSRMPGSFDPDDDDIQGGFFGDSLGDDEVLGDEDTEFFWGNEDPSGPQDGGKGPNPTGDKPRQPASQTASRMSAGSRPGRQTPASGGATPVGSPGEFLGDSQSDEVLGDEGLTDFSWGFDNPTESGDTEPTSGKT